MHQKGGGFHSGQVTCPDWRFDPRWGRLWEAGDRCFSNTLRFLPYLSTGGVDVRSHRRRYLRPGEGAVAQSRLTEGLGVALWCAGAVPGRAHPCCSGGGGGRGEGNGGVSPGEVGRGAPRAGCTEHLRCGARAGPSGALKAVCARTWGCRAIGGRGGSNPDPGSAQILGWTGSGADGRGLRHLSPWRRQRGESARLTAVPGRPAPSMAGSGDR